MDDQLIAAGDEARALQSALRQYRQPSVARGIGQLATSVVPYVAGVLAMGVIAQVSYPLSLLLALPTAGFLIRIFIIFHDAGHGSFLPASRWNRAGRLRRGNPCLHAVPPLDPRACHAPRRRR